MDGFLFSEVNNILNNSNLITSVALFELIIRGNHRNEIISSLQNHEK